MTQFNTVMDIFKLLNKSNCRKCHEPTCLAFAAAVFKGDKQLQECPKLDKEILEQYAGKGDRRLVLEQARDESVEQLKSKIADIDLAAAAQRLGAKFSNEKLTLKCLGKDFSVDTSGNITTDIHVNPWIAIPVLNYILSGAGRSVSDRWVPFRELEGGKDWYRLFGQMCEKPLKKVADVYTDLFEDMLHIFNGKRVAGHYNADISIVLHPLPKVPILICYWRPEEGLESSLNVFFDATAEENLNIESLYTLATGLVIMFKQIALHHGFQ